MFWQEIKAGTELLDAKVPSWDSKIDTATLDIANSCECIVGQALPDEDFDQASALLFGDNWTMSDLHSHGLAVDCSGFDYVANVAICSQEWIQIIEMRRRDKR